jgi:molybdenum cofactor cytidylyltransferase
MIGAIILAAGRSTRMGHPKLLLPHGEKTVIQHLVHEVSGAQIAPIIVVGGHKAHAIKENLADVNTSPQFVTNKKYDQGMLSSIRCGLRALPEETEAAMVILGDQLSLSTSLVRELAHFFTSSATDIAIASHDGRRGHPIIFSEKYFKEVLSQFDDTGLRGLLQAHPDDIATYLTNDPGVLIDVDTPQQYNEEIQRLNDKED